MSISVFLQLIQTHPLQIHFGYILSQDVFSPSMLFKYKYSFSVRPNANAAKLNATHELRQFDKQLNVIDSMSSCFSKFIFR